MAEGQRERASEGCLPGRRAVSGELSRADLGVPVMPRIVNACRWQA